jgi:hypothetical protein
MKDLAAVVAVRTLRYVRTYVQQHTSPPRTKLLDYCYLQTK